ncbi:MAG: PQQ-dependent sugar dehydrogenase [Lewinellaceae bacterium]|nr:PQQ-dependent sugar dehydrogenase [Lewinellaceae bacterium]
MRPGAVFSWPKRRQVLLFHDGVLRSQPFLTLQVDDYNEKGLNGIAIDPDFENNPWVYLYYTVKAHNTTASAGSCQRRLCRAGQRAGIDGSRPAQRQHTQRRRNGVRARQFVGIGVGDGAKSDNAQSLNTVLGKILRLESDGSIPADNPFSACCRAIIARFTHTACATLFHGLRPATGKIYFSDVGAEAWEEVNELTPGATTAGNSTRALPGNPAFTDPKYAYNHSEVAPSWALPSPFTTTTWYRQYRGKFFFADYCQGWIRMLDPATGTLSGSLLPVSTGR